MAISKVIYKTSAAATPEVWMDATPATAAAADILAPKTAMLADGVVTTGTGTGGGGGSIYQDEDGYIVLDPNGTSGGGAVKRKEVNFIDSYDGSIVASYTTAEFANLTELPANPSHTGLTAQGWNMPSSWTLANAKSYIVTNKCYDWGQMYTTDDGKTRVYIHLEEGRTSPILGCCPNGTVDVDWGDGTAHDTLTGTSVTTVKWTPTHNYTTPGDYVIKLTVTGSMGLYGSNSTNQYCGLLHYASTSDNRNRYYIAAIRRVEIGSNVTSISTYAFAYCYSLTSITIPSGVTSMGTYAFYYCYSLTSITIPSGVTSIGNYTFQYCYSITSLTIPSDVTSIGSGAFERCHSITSLTIPSGVTSIGSSTFSSCYSITSLTIPSGVTSIAANAFLYCYSLTSITIPSGVTIIDGNTFGSCYSLTSITIPSGVTSIGGTAFGGCHSITSLTIPSDVTSIGNNAFSNCYGLASLHFKPTTPPIVSNNSAFLNLPTDCIIYVPTGSLSDYTTATNYPDSNTYTYIEE